MAHPADNGQILNDITDAREYERDEGFKEGKASRDAEVAGLTSSLAQASDARDQAQAALEQVREEFEAYKAAHPDTPDEPDPEPEPEPEPPTLGLPPLIGSSSQPPDWNDRKAMLEATGGRLEARRVFCTTITNDKSAVLRECAAQNTVPVISIKPGPYTWAQVAAGQGDSALRTQAARIKATWGDRLCYVAFHHEPDQQSDPKTVGEGGPASDFPKAWARFLDVLEPLLPNAKFGPILNGWWFSAQARGYTDPELNVWLPKSIRDRLDFIGADHYNSEGQSESALDRIKRMVSWMDRVQFAGPTLIGETNGWVPADLDSVFGYAKTSKRFAGGAALLWNSTGEEYRPVHETGLLDDFQRILKGWRA